MANQSTNGLYKSVAQAGMTAGSVASPRTPKFKLPSGVNNGGRYDVPMQAPANKRTANGVNFSGARGSLGFPAQRQRQPQQQGNVMGQIMQGAPGSPMVSPPMVGQPAQVSPAQFMGGFNPMPMSQGQPGGINPGGNMFPGAPIGGSYNSPPQQWNPQVVGQMINRAMPGQIQARPAFTQQAPIMATTGMGGPMQQEVQMGQQPMRPMPFRGMPQLM